MPAGTGQHPRAHRHQQPKQRVAAVGETAVRHQFGFKLRIAEPHRQARAEQERAEHSREPEREPFRPQPAHDARQQRAQRQTHHRQRRHDVHIALAAGDREEHHDQQPPRQRQQIARVAAAQTGAPCGKRPDQRERSRQPGRRHHRQVVPRRLRVVPRFRVAAGGLPEQDVVEIGLVFRVVLAQRGKDHRHQPQRGGEHERQRPEPEFHVARMHPHPRPLHQRSDHRRQDHQQRQTADALGNGAQPGREPAQRPQLPVRPQQQMPQQPVIGEGDEERHQRIDLRFLRLIGELQREQQRPRRIQPDLARPQPAAQVVHAPQRAQRRQQRRQQERDAPVAEHGVERRFQPHQHRRLVRVQLGAAMRKQPVAALDHLLGDQRETRFVRRPRVAQAQSGAQHQQGDDGQQPEFSRFAGFQHGGNDNCEKQILSPPLRAAGPFFK